VIRLVIIGAGGHARVVLDAARTMDVTIAGFVEPESSSELIDGVAIVGTDRDLGRIRASGATHGVVGVGSVQPGTRRAELFARLNEAGLDGAVIVHRAATVSPRASIGAGSVVLARAVLNPGVAIGRNAIVNTGALIEHDCVIGDHAHVSPGAVLGGGVRVGEHSHVGIGATVIQGIVIGARAFVAAGAVVTRDVPNDSRVAGVPAARMG
jgi:sugar O-acyltransferase (sialic acid O-acetyltransferase NeuD family)